jgi:hypothetical protein
MERPCGVFNVGLLNGTSKDGKPIQTKSPQGFGIGLGPGFPLNIPPVEVGAA